MRNRRVPGAGFGALPESSAWLISRTSGGLPVLFTSGDCTDVLLKLAREAALLAGVDDGLDVDHAGPGRARG